MLPLHGLQRLEMIMDEYVGGIGSNYTTNEPLLNRGLELLGMLKEDLNHLGAEDLHQLQRAWELQHRVLASESVTHHTMYRTETRWPGYYYRGDHPASLYPSTTVTPEIGKWKRHRCITSSIRGLIEQTFDVMTGRPRFQSNAHCPD
jgi:succinate dehydrogenase/fumarate reductase flavoprotein subunit